jgi:type 1 glutamine amidotransferase
MKALVFCDDYWHPARIAREGLGALTGTEFTFDWIEKTRDWSPETMLNYPVVILTKSNNVSSIDQTGWMTDRVQAAFLEYVHNGHGLLAIHSGTAEYDQIPVLRRLLGGVFHHHPEQCPVTVTPHAGHPLSAGSAPFTLKDEQYFMTMDDPEVDVFVTTTSEHGEQPGAWRHVEGNGRVAVLTPGHNLEVWLHPSFQALLINSLRWCGKLPENKVNMTGNVSDAGLPSKSNR